jgi:serine/threonine-protein kinase
MQGGAVQEQGSLIGATIGNYRVTAKLGEGGMGSVYLAEHPLIGKKVALKVLHEEYSANQDVVTRFFNEAKAVNDIGHPNIVDIIDYGVVQTQQGPGFVYFIMEFLNGKSLAEVIQTQSPIAPERGLAICAQVADALSASHAKGIIHRDLKPDNIYLISRGRDTDFVKVLDFGIAKLTGDSPGSRKTRTGIVMGTPAYMSPEQCEGKGNIDHRTDIYALGIVMYELITGRVPFLGEGYGEVLVQHLTKRPERPSTVRGAIPPSVEAVCMKALEKKREDRFQSMEQFISAMRDPQAWVDANGGLAAFMPDATMPVGSGGPMPPGAAATPYPVQQPTMGPRPTTLNAGAGEVVAAAEPIAPPKSKTPIYAAAAVGGVAVLALVGWLAFGGKKKNNDSGSTQQAAATPVKDDPKPKTPDPTPQPKVDPVKTPEAPKTVTISVTSNPPGADIFVGTETTSRGLTPTDVTMPKSDGEVQVTLKLSGYADRTKSVKTDRDAGVDLDLTKAAVAVQPPPQVPNNGQHHHQQVPPGGGGKKPPGGGTGDKDGVISPF